MSPSRGVVRSEGQAVITGLSIQYGPVDAADRESKRRPKPLGYQCPVPRRRGSRGLVFAAPGLLPGNGLAATLEKTIKIDQARAKWRVRWAAALQSRWCQIL